MARRSAKRRPLERSHCCDRTSAGDVASLSHHAGCIRFGALCSFVGQDIADMERQKRQEFQEHLEVNAARIASEKDGTAALPSQIGDSKLFHQIVLKQYG